MGLFRALVRCEMTNERRTINYGSLDSENAKGRSQNLGKHRFLDSLRVDAVTALPGSGACGALERFRSCGLLSDKLIRLWQQKIRSRRRPLLLTWLDSIRSPARSRPYSHAFFRPLPRVRIAT